MNVLKEFDIDVSEVLFVISLIFFVPFSFEVDFDKRLSPISYKLGERKKLCNFLNCSFVAFMCCLLASARVLVQLTLRWLS